MDAFITKMVPQGVGIIDVNSAVQFTFMYEEEDGEYNEISFRKNVNVEGVEDITQLPKSYLYSGPSKTER